MISLAELEGHVVRARQVERVRDIARGCGYAVAVHGSMSSERDLDLIAVPWTDDACEPAHLLHELETEFVLGDQAKKPHGRLAVVLHGVAGFKYADLSIAPTWQSDVQDEKSRPA